MPGVAPTHGCWARTIPRPAFFGRHSVRALDNKGCYAPGNFGPLEICSCVQLLNLESATSRFFGVRRQREGRMFYQATRRRRFGLCTTEPVRLCTGESGVASRPDKTSAFRCHRTPKKQLAASSRQASRSSCKDQGHATAFCSPGMATALRKSWTQLHSSRPRIPGAAALAIQTLLLAKYRRHQRI